MGGRRIAAESGLVALLTAGVLVASALVFPALAEDTAADIVSYGWASDPGAAPGQADPLTDPLEDAGTQGADTVPPGSVPVGLRAGSPSHVSFLKFDVSSIPSEAQISSATLTLTEVQASPNITSILSCRLTAPFEEGEGQAFAKRPAFDEFGCNGVEPNEDGSWTINMAFTVRQWVTGAAENHGIELQPGGPDNLPTGQPDPTTMTWLALFAGPESETPPVLTVTYSLPVVTDDPAPVVPPPAQADDPAPPPPPQESTQNQGGFAFSAPPLSAAPPAAESPDAAPQEPEVAEPPPAQDPVPAPVATEIPEPYTPWTVYLLVPLLAAVAYGLFRAFTADVAVTGAREGATSRLLRQRALARQSAGEATFVGA